MQFLSSVLEIYIYQRVYYFFTFGIADNIQIPLNHMKIIKKFKDGSDNANLKLNI